jgi:hypothetical protein
MKKEKIIQLFDLAINRWINEVNSEEIVGELFYGELDEIRQVLAKYLPEDFVWPNKIRDWRVKTCHYLALEYDDFMMVCESDLHESLFVDVYEAVYDGPKRLFFSSIKSV